MRHLLANQGSRYRRDYRGVCLDPRIGPSTTIPASATGVTACPKAHIQLFTNYRDAPSNMMKAAVKSNVPRKDFDAGDAVYELDDFQSRSNLIAANCWGDKFSDAEDKVYTRVLFKKDKGLTTSSTRMQS